MTLTPPPARRPAPVLRLKRILPRSLFGRTLLIIVLPTLITLAAATYVFFDRHWYTVTNRMAYALAGDVAAVVELMHDSSTPESRATIADLAASKMDLTVTFLPGATMTPHIHHRLDPLRDILKERLDNRLRYPYDVNMHASAEMIAIRVVAPEGIY